MMTFEMLVASLLIIWVLGVIILLINPRNKANILCSIFAFLSGLGIITSMNWELLDYYHANFSKDTINNILLAHSIVSGITHFLSPIVYMLFVVEYSNILSNHRRKKLLLCLSLSLPWLSLFFLFPITNFVYYFYETKIYWQVVKCLSIVYFLICNSILLYSIIIEKNFKIRQQRLLVFLLIAPIIFNATIVCYWTGSEPRSENMLWFYIVLFVLIICFLFVFRQGFMGIKLRLERIAVDMSYKKINSGIQVFIHTLNREIGTIKSCAANIDMTNKNLETHKDIEIMKNSINHITLMLARTKDSIRNFKLDTKPVKVNNVVKLALKGTKNIIGDKKISINLVMNSNSYILCDDIHLIEILRNLLKNSAEAIEHEGEIIVSTYENFGKVYISLKDNGQGISSQYQPYIYDFYFSTKNNQNLGLGLYYCYNMMQLHNGSIDIQSKEGKGTTVFLGFPTFKKHAGKEHKNNAQNKSGYCRRRSGLPLFSKKIS